MVFLFNYIKIAIWSGLYYFQGKKSDIIMKIIINNIRDSGCVAIKFCQWILPKLEAIYDIDNSQENNKWFKDLEDLYEECNYHNINHTKKIYYRSFNSQLDEDYEIISLIASGSIGQVYKVKDKHTNAMCAMKVVHPDMQFQLLFFDYFINILYLVPFIRNIFNYYIPIELKEFIKDFKIQCDLINEANNCLRFYEEYKDNQLIIIPEIYRVSEKIMIMKYEEGGRIEDINISDYNIYKLLLLLKLFIKSNELIFHLMHGDLHKGNWKVRIDDGIPKLVIYDFGFCWKVPKFIYSNLSKIDNAFMNVQDNKEDTIKEFGKACWYFINKKIPIEYMHKEIKIVKEETKLNYDDPSLLLKLIINCCRKYKFIIDSFIIQSVILHIQMQKNFENYYITRPILENNLDSLGFEYYNRRIHDIINLCKTYSVFDGYCKFLESEFIEEKVEIKELFGTIEKDNGLEKYDFLKGLAIKDTNYNLNI